MEIVKISRVVDDIFLWIIIKCIDDYGIVGEYDKIVADNEDDDTNDDGDDDDDDTNEDGEGGITDKHHNVFSRQVEPEINFCTIPSKHLW